jgi:hypothetical protein
MDFRGKQFVRERALSQFTNADTAMARDILAEEVKRLAGVVERLVLPWDKLDDLDKETSDGC